MLEFLMGLGALVLGAELLVRGATRLALSLGITPLVVGLTVVAFGTSAPELAVTVESAWAGQVDLALGNVVGSNIFNLLVILGLSALITPLVVHQQVIRQEVPVLIGASLLLWALALDGGISRWEGFLMTGLVLGYTALLIRQSRRETAAVQADVEVEYEEAFDRPDKDWQAHWGVQALFILAGLALLVLGAGWLVEAAVGFARHLGVSELVIGLTVVAAGTSLPEVATSVMAALRGERDIAVGNAVGSSVFNILAVLGISASVAPSALAVAPAMLAFDIPLVVAVAVVCLPVFYVGSRISRWDGALLLGLYGAYTLYLVLQASGYGGLGMYSKVMGGLVLPLVALVLLGQAAWQWHRHHRRLA